MNIPNKAKKVFSGEIFDTYQWQQEMFDGSLETFEMLNRDDTVQIFPIIDNTLVILHEEQPTMPRAYGVVGGRIDKGEEPLACAQRELLEETGLVSDDWELYNIFEPYAKIDWKMYRFIARNCKKHSEQKLDAGEKIELQHVTLDEFIDYAMQDDFRSKDITFELLKMYYNNSLDEFKRKLFG